MDAVYISNATPQELSEFLARQNVSVGSVVPVSPVTPAKPKAVVQSSPSCRKVRVPRINPSCSKETKILVNFIRDKLGLVITDPLDIVDRKTNRKEIQDAPTYYFITSLKKKWVAHASHMKHTNRECVISADGYIEAFWKNLLSRKDGAKMRELYKAAQTSQKSITFVNC